MRWNGVHPLLAMPLLQLGEQRQAVDVGQTDVEHEDVGSMALVISPTGAKRHLWRFGDDPGDPVLLGEGRLFR